MPVTSCFPYCFYLLSICQSDVRLKVKQSSCYLETKVTCKGCWGREGDKNQVFKFFGEVHHHLLCQIWTLYLLSHSGEVSLMCSPTHSSWYSRTEWEPLPDQPQRIWDQQELRCGEASQGSPRGHCLNWEINSGLGQLGDSLLGTNRISKTWGMGDII